MAALFLSHQDAHVHVTHHVFSLRDKYFVSCEKMTICGLWPPSHNESIETAKT